MGKDIAHSVREAAVRIIGDISQVAPIEIRQNSLIETFEDFYNDSHKKVKKAALMQLGQFIYSLKGSKIPKSLLNFYASLADQSKTEDEDLMYHCAYTFPAVLQAVGKKEWPSLKPIYHNLIKKNKPQISKTMAAYIHEIAKIVGTKITTAELTEVLKEYLKNEETKTIVLTHLHDFFRVLDPNQRLNYLPYMKSIIEESKFAWRQREIFAYNAHEYAKLFDIKTLHNEIMPIVYKLLKDDVYQVRNQACRNFYNVVIQLKSKDFKKAIEFVLKLFVSESYYDRQSFIKICEGFMHNQELFHKYFLTQFLTLQRDKILNVRLTLAKVLHSHMKSSGLLVTNIHIGRTIELLKNDLSKEVRECINKASKEWNKMEEIERERQEELESAQEIVAGTIGGNSSFTSDEESTEELLRLEAIKVLKETIKVDELDVKTELPNSL